MLPDNPVRAGVPGDCYDDSAIDHSYDDVFAEASHDEIVELFSDAERMIYQRCLFGCES